MNERANASFFLSGRALKSMLTRSKLEDFYTYGRIYICMLKVCGVSSFWHICMVKEMKSSSGLKELLHSHTIDLALSKLVVAWHRSGNLPMAVKNVACCGLRGCGGLSGIDQ
jgi:hypothetical protein